MKTSIILLMSLFFLNSAQASDTYVQGILGFDSGAINFGGDYESKQSKNLGYGAYFLYSAESDNIAPQTISFGGMIKLHVFTDSKFDVSLAPGFGITMIEFGNSDETTFGPVLKTSVLYKVSDKMAVGGEMFKAYNWLSDEAQGSIDYLNVVVRFKL